MIKGGTNMEFSIITLIIGILGFVLGFMVRKYKMGNLVSWVNLKKYDNDKLDFLVNLKKNLIEKVNMGQ